MNDGYAAALQAVRDKQKLDDLHQVFLNALASTKKEVSEIGSLKVNDSRMEGNVLGFSIAVDRRLVANELGRFQANEYTFSICEQARRHVVWRLFLPQHEALYRSLDGGGLLCRLSNTYLYSTLLYELAAAIPKSDTFSPGGTARSSTPSSTN